MLESRDVFDQEIRWEPKVGHSRVWFDNWTQLGALHYYLLIDRHKDYQIAKASQLCTVD